MKLLKFLDSPRKKTNGEPELITASHANGKVPLGQAVTFQINHLNLTGLTLKTFVTYQGICYLQDLGKWDEQNQLVYFPEATGEYILKVSWANGQKKGWLTKDFEVVINKSYSPTPTVAKVSPIMELWTPSTWEANQFQHHEKEVVEYLDSLVKPGWVIYDVGANMGVFSVQFSQLVGDAGKVYCVEANPLCVYFLRANFHQNSVRNATIFPVALSNDSAPIEFRINYGNSGLGITKNSVFYQSKIGHSIRVNAITFDDLVDQFDLDRPNLIKVDIEGAEEYVVPAMQKTIEASRPILLLELHGFTAGVNTLRFLDAYNYRYMNICTKVEYPNAGTLISTFKDEVIQVVALPQ